MPLKKSGENFSPILSQRLFLKISLYSYQEHSNIYFSFFLIFHGFYVTHLLSSLCLFICRLCICFLFVFSVTLWSVSGCCLDVLNMLPLLCFPMDSMLITGETFCLQKQNQHSKQIWEYGTISPHSNCHVTMEEEPPAFPFWIWCFSVMMRWASENWCDLYVH